MPNNNKIIEPIDASVESVVKKATPKPFNNKGLNGKTTKNILKSGQLELPIFHSDVHTETQGIEMGVLESGIPYLSQRGLVKMAGIGRTSFQSLTKNWKQEKHKSDISVSLVSVCVSAVPDPETPSTDATAIVPRPSPSTAFCGLEPTADGLSDDWTPAERFSELAVLF